MQARSLDHIHIYARDPQASMAFWHRHFDARKILETQNIHHQEVHLLQIGGGGPAIAFSEPPPGIPLPDAPITDAAGREGMGARGVMHLGVNVPDVRAAVAELRDAGVRVLTEPAEAYGVTFAYVEAPDGVLIELTQY